MNNAHTFDPTPPVTRSIGVPTHNIIIPDDVPSSKTTSFDVDFSPPLLICPFASLRCATYDGDHPYKYWCIKCKEGTNTIYSPCVRCKYHAVSGLYVK